MAFTINSRPQKNLSGNVSKISAIWPGINYGYKGQRIDIVPNTHTNNGGFVQLVCNGIDLRPEISVGDVVYYISANGIAFGTFGSFTVTSITFGGGNTTIVLNAPYLGVDTPGYMNYKKGWYLEVQIQTLFPAAGLVDTIQVGSKPDGQTQINVGQSILPILRTTRFIPSFIQDTPTIRFYINYREVWRNGSSSTTSDIAQVHIVARGILPVFNLNKPSYVEYDCFENTNFLFKFLTPLTQLTLWKGMPCFLEWFTSNPSLTTRIRIERRRADDSVISFDNVSPSVNFNTLTATYNVNDLSLTDDTAYLLAYVGEAPLSSPIYSETIRINVKEPCEDPVMLIWRSNLGGTVCWCFNRIRELEYKDGKQEVWKLSADSLTINEWNVLNELLYNEQEIQTFNGELFEPSGSITRSTSVRYNQPVIYTHTGLGVIVESDKSKTRSHLFRHQFECNIKLPTFI